jgi:hypothetical protein
LRALDPTKVIAAAMPPITTMIARILVNIRNRDRNDIAQPFVNFCPSDPPAKYDRKKRTAVRLRYPGGHIPRSMVNTGKVIIAG